MVYNKLTKEAFVHPPKTGTVTTQKFLKNLGWKQLQSRHPLPEKLIEAFPELNEYTLYGFLRDPLKRFESAVLFCKQTDGQGIFEVLRTNGISDSVETVSYETLIGVFSDLNNRLRYFFDPQAAWLGHHKVTVLDFSNMEKELRRITGDTESLMTLENASTDYGRSVITQKVIDFVRQHYAADYALAKERLGIEY